MEIKKNKTYFLADLMRALKEAGLPGSKNTILYKYEKKGIIPSPRRKATGWRVYTGKQLVEIVNMVQEAIEEGLC